MASATSGSVRTRFCMMVVPPEGAHEDSSKRGGGGERGYDRAVTHLPVIGSKRGESRVRSGHPWIFRSDVARASVAPAGAVVRVLGPTGRPPGVAFLSAPSRIRLPLLYLGAS